jgi:hypothetical protein
MSGGHFNYAQYRIKEIADSIQQKLDDQGKLKSKEDLWMSKDYYEAYPEEKFEYTYPKNIQKEFLNAIKALNIAAIYAQRVDYLLSGDDGEENFLIRLKEELSKIK